MKTYKRIFLAIALIGSINWGLIALFDFNILVFIFNDTLLTKIIYLIISLSALLSTILLFDKED